MGAKRRAAFLGSDGLPFFRRARLTVARSCSYGILGVFFRRFRSACLSLA